MLLMAGSVSFAQPTSGDIILVELDSAEALPELAAPQQAFEPSIIAAFKAGNAKKIALYFGDNVDLSILGKANLYSKSQAEQILQHFFSEHKPADFKIIHKGGEKSSKYYIGQLTAMNGDKFRVTLNNKSGTGSTITSLTIEEN